MTSRFNRLSVIDQALLIILIAATSLVLLPYRAAASTDLPAPVAGKQTAIVFEIKNLSTIKIPTNYTDQNDTPTAEEIAAQQAQIEQANFDQNVAILQAYLSQKGSPLADHADTLLKSQNWKLVLAISNGESTMCKHQMYNNCWGIGGAWNMKRYSSLDEGIVDVDNLITNKYVARGADTPKEIVNRYVGSYSPSWVAAVSQTLNQVNQLPMVD